MVIRKFLLYSHLYNARIFTRPRKVNFFPGQTTRNPCTCNIRPWSAIVRLHLGQTNTPQKKKTKKSTEQPHKQRFLIAKQNLANLQKAQLEEFSTGRRGTSRDTNIQLDQRLAGDKWKEWGADEQHLNGWVDLQKKQNRTQSKKQQTKTVFADLWICDNTFRRKCPKPP